MKKEMEWFWDAHLPDVSKRKEITARPLNASLDQLKGLPDALLAVDENDVLRDEGETYARKLSQAGVGVTSVRYNGTIRDFALLNAITNTRAVRGGIQQENDAFKVALQRQIKVTSQIGCASPARTVFRSVIFGFRKV